MPRFKVNPGRPSGISPLTIPLCWLRSALRPSPPASSSSYGAMSSFRECGLPYGLCVTLCTPQLCRSAGCLHCLCPRRLVGRLETVCPNTWSFLRLSKPSLACLLTAATLGKGGWLNLTLRGLAPRQKALSLPSAPTRCSAAEDE